MPEPLAGTVALVTGASSGIGRATALGLAERGATVATVARRSERLAKLVAEVAAAGGSAHAFEADLNGSAAASDLVDRVAAELGRIDVLVNAAGRMLNGPTLELADAEWEEMLSVNVAGLAFASKAAIPHLLRAAEEGPRGVADLVNVSSVAGKVPKPEIAFYDLTKFGVNGFTEALRQEFTQRNLRVSVIAPGFVDTELFDYQHAPTRERFAKLRAPLECLRAEDVAEEIAHVVSRPRRVAINEVVIRPTDQA